VNFNLLKCLRNVGAGLRPRPGVPATDGLVASLNPRQPTHRADPQIDAVAQLTRSRPVSYDALPLRAYSSVGELLPYKQAVVGSIPTAPIRSDNRDYGGKPTPLGIRNNPGLAGRC
jgi:hypothetical protein